jgi:hypothetical protein
MSDSTAFVQATVTGPDWAKNQGLQRIVAEEYGKAIRKSLNEGKRILKQEIQDSKAVASRTLLESVASRVQSLALGSFVYAGNIYFKSPADKYAGNADKGRPAGKISRPMVASIRAWMGIKGIDEKFLWPIVMQIARQGTGVQFWNLWGRTSFMDVATDKIDAQVKVEFEKASTVIQSKIENAKSVVLS